MSSTNVLKEVIALVDCDNFFVSCERVFDPSLKNRPVVVLSHKNGIVLARSQEAKPLVPMGAASFRYREIFQQHNVIEIFTHFSLYSNMSERVMSILHTFTPSIEIYSIDEAFLHLQMKECDLITLGEKIKQTILQCVGIPVSIGFAPTKTLAKVATHFAKKERKPIFINEDNRDEFLKKLPIQEVWGIGSKLSEKLRKHSIYTALDFIEKSDTFIRKELSVIGLRIALELRGISCNLLEDEGRDRKSISTYRTLPGISSLSMLSSILARYTSQLAKTLRSENRQASYMVVSLSTNLHEEEVYSRSLSFNLPEATSYTPTLIKEAKRLLSMIYKPDLNYKKLGVLLDGLVYDKEVQVDIFLQKSEEERIKERKLMNIIDNVNEKFGEGSLFFACEQKKEKTQLSHRYTSSWNELLKVRA